MGESYYNRILPEVLAELDTGDLEIVGCSEVIEMPALLENLGELRDAYKIR